MSRVVSKNRNLARDFKDVSRNRAEDESECSNHTNKLIPLETPCEDYEQVNDTVGPSIFLGEYTYEVDTMKSRTFKASSRVNSLNTKVYRDVSKTLGTLNQSLEVQLAEKDREKYDEVIERCIAFQSTAVDIINLDNGDPNARPHHPANIRHVIKFKKDSEY